MCASLRFRLGERPGNTFYYQRDIENYTDQVLDFLLFDRHEYVAHRIFRSVILVDKAKLCYTDTDSSIIHIKTEDLHKDIANDVETWFDTSNYNEIDKRPLPVRKNKKVIGLFKYELGVKIMIEFVGLRAKKCMLND